MSFVQKQNVSLSFTNGLQSKTDDFQVQSPNLLELQNACFNKLGKLNKRFGYDILSTSIMGGGTILSSSAIDVFNDELNLFDNQNVYTYISSKAEWANRGPAISVINTNKEIIHTASAQQINPDSAILNGIEVYTWEDSRGSVRYSVTDISTSAYIVADRPIEGADQRPKCLVFNNLIYIFYTRNNNLSARIINPANPHLISDAINFAADAITDFTYDVVPTSTNLFIVYQTTSSGSPALNILVVDTSNNILLTGTPATGSQAYTDITKSTIDLYVDSHTILWITWSTGSALYTSSFNVTVPTSPSSIINKLLIESGQFPYVTGIESNTSGNLQITYEVYSPITTTESVKSVIIDPSASITSVGTLRSVGLASKAFRYLNNIYINLAHQSTLQSTYFTAQLTNSPFNIVGKISSQVAGGLRTNRLLQSVDQLSPGVFIWSNLVKGQFISEDNTNFSLLGVNSTKIDFTNVNKFNSVTQSNNLLFVGGILQSYDGISVVEQNFHLFPENLSATILPSGGALSVGQYQYQAVYAWTDKFGQIQYSSPSTPITISSLTPTTSVQLTIPTLRITNKTGVVIKVYRTQANGVLFNEVTSELAPLLNNPTVDSVTFTDTAADINIAANQLIYTTGGVLPNSAPPSCSLISLYQDRVMLSGLEDPNLIWFSKNKFNNTNFNTIPVEFSSQLTIGVSQTGGPITALGLMDDKLIIFKKNSIFVLTGDGPNDLGGGDQFAAPELVTNSIGCTNPNSVVLTKDGIMFQSDKGIWLLDRGLGAPQYIGAGVDDFAKQYLISSAVIDPNDNLVIFTTYEGPTLVYDYYIQQWSTYTNHESVDGLAFSGVFAFCKPNGQVYVQNRTKFTDGANPIYMELVTPWLSFAGMQGYQRVFRSFLLGQFKGPHSLNISVGYNFNPAFTQFATIDATSVAGSNTWGGDGYWAQSTPWGGTFQPYEFQINFATQTCTSLRLKIADSQILQSFDRNHRAIVYNEGYTISNLSFEVGMLTDHNRLPLANKVGTS